VSVACRYARFQASSRSPNGSGARGHERGGTVGRHLDDMALVRQRSPQRRSETRVIIHHEDPRARRHACDDGRRGSVSIGESMASVHLGDIDTSYELSGAGDPVVLIHGLGSSARDWERQLPALVDRYRVLTYDVRGHGRTSKPRGPYSVAQFANDLALLLEKLAHRPAHVVGISMGGMIAFQLAVDRPDLVRSLVIVNSGPALVPSTLAEHLAVWSRIAIARLRGPGAMGGVLAPRLFPSPDQEPLRRQFVERWAENDKDAYYAALRAIIGWSVRDRVGGIRCPVLVVAADHDYTPVSAKEAYLPLIPGATLKVIADARHATPVEHPQAFNAVLREFLDARPAPQT
jgi:3-oxoadipate enol-lactonase